MAYLKLAIFIVFSGSGNEILSPILISSRCAAQCTNGTNCVNCERNWFGPKCQIRDLMQFATMYNNLTVLTDRSDVTCEKKPRDLFDIVFNPPQFFIWIYLVFTPKTVLWLTEFHLVLNVSDVPENCTNLRQVTENLHKVYITCTKYGVTQVVSGIRLSWAGPKTLCSVYVYGGRNVALNQKINSLNIVGTLQEQPRSIVDGLKTVNCTRSRPSNDTQTLVIDLGHPKLVHEIIIYRTSRENSLYPMTNFIVALVSENDSVVFASFNQQHDRGDQVFKFSVETVDPAQKLRFYLYPSSLEEQFYYDLCEVEVFGDCGLSKYGANCEMTCMDTCNNGKCLPNGFCLDCDLKNSHKHCDEEAEFQKAQFKVLSRILGAPCHCSPEGCNSSCKNRTDCLDGWFGHNCLYNEFSPFVVMNHAVMSAGEDGGDCVTTNEVHVTQAQINPFGVAWLRVTLSPGAVATEAGFLDNITYRDGCQRLHVTQETTKDLVFYCEGGESINSDFVIRLPANRSVCGTRLITGRSLMPITKTDLISRPDAIPAKSSAGGTIKPLPYWLRHGATYALVIRFLAPVFPYNIVMYTDDEVTEDVLLEIKYLNNGTELTSESLNYTSLESTYIFHNRPRDPVDTVVVKLWKGQMVVLYLHVLGECAPPYYGLRCTEECPTKCAGRRCYVDGSCLECKGCDADFDKAVTDDSNGPTFSYLGLIFLVGVAVTAVWSTVFSYRMFRADTPKPENPQTQTTEIPDDTLNKAITQTNVTNYMVFPETRDIYVVGVTTSGDIIDVNTLSHATTTDDE